MIKMTDLWTNVQLPAEINHIQEIEYIIISLLNLKCSLSNGWKSGHSMVIRDFKDSSSNPYFKDEKIEALKCLIQGHANSYEPSNRFWILRLNSVNFTSFHIFF